jgi:multiple sugar transport system ATP-binding protein
MNFIKTKYIENKDGIIKMESDDLSFEFKPNTPLTVKIEKGDQLVIGLRPEHIEIDENGSMNSSIYSTLPSGLETVIKLKINNTILTSVAFGGVDYKVNAPIRTHFNSNKYILFNNDSRENFSMGTIIVKS